MKKTMRLMPTMIRGRANEMQPLSRFFQRGAIAGLLYFGSALPASEAMAQEPKGHSFIDEFDTFDLDRWMPSDGWANGDHQNCGWSREEINVKDGKLLVGFSKHEASGRQYRCGEVQTRAVYGYGTYETRLRTPVGPGLNANIFTFIGAVHGMPHDEIDFEFLLKDTRYVQLNVFRDGKGGNEQLAILENSSDAEFTDYAIVWEPRAVSWYINSKLVRRIDDSALLPSNDSKIYLSLWGTDTLKDWMGEFRDPGQPIAMEVERVAFTAKGDACQFNDSLVCTQTTGN